MNPDHQAEAMSSSRSSSHSHASFADVDSLVAKFNASAAVTTPEAFTDKQKQQQLEAKRSFSKARDNITGIRLSLGSAMAAVKPKSIAKMATNAVQLRHTKSGQQSSLVASPSHLSVESSDPTFGVRVLVAQQDDDTMEVSGNPLWALAKAIQCDDVSNALACVEQWESAEDFDPDDDNDSRDSSNSNKEVEEIYVELQENMSARDMQGAVLVVSASLNRIAIVRAILADKAVNGVGWSSKQEDALDAACAKGHVEIAKLVACVDDGQVSSTLTPSLALRYYCLAGDMERAQMILSTSDSPDVTTIKAALLDACINGRCDIVALLTADARYDPSVDGEEALIEACENGQVEVVSLLLRDLGLSIELDDLQHALTFATDAGHCDVVDLMVQNPIVNPGLDKLFALEQYCLVGNVERVKEALDDPALIDFLPREFFFAASSNGHEGVVKLLLADPRVDPAARSNDAMRLASSNGHVSVVELLLQDPRVDPCAQGNAAIQRASRGGHESVVKLLLADSRVDPAGDDNEPIREASSKGHLGIVKLLLVHPRVDPAAEDNDAIREASFRGHAGVVKLLLADPRVDPSAHENAAIKDASNNGYASVVKLLLTNPRVDPAADDDYAIRLASSNGHASVVALLLADPRVDPGAQDNVAIGDASREGQARVVKLLLADPRVDPSMGRPTALEHASGEGYVEVVLMLLAHPKVVVTKTALLGADKEDHGNIVRLLIDKQPRVLQTMFESATPCKSGGALEVELRQREKASAMTLVLAVERFDALMRVSDVLREVVVEYACFDLIADGSEVGASTSSDGSGGSS